MGSWTILRLYELALFASVVVFVGCEKSTTATLSSTDPLPNSYGLWAVSGKDLRKLEPAGTKMTFVPKVSSLIFFDNRLELLDTQAAKSPLTRARFLEEEIERIHRGKDGPIIDQISARFNSWTNTNEQVKVAFQPIAGQPQMVRIVPEEGFLPGGYVLNLKVTEPFWLATGDSLKSASYATAVDKIFHTLDKMRSTEELTYAFERDRPKAEKLAHGRMVYKVELVPANTQRRIPEPPSIEASPETTSNSPSPDAHKLNVGSQPNPTTGSAPATESASYRIAINGIGPVRLGMSLDEVEKSWEGGFHGDRKRYGTSDCFFLSPIGFGEDAKFWVINNKLHHISITSSSFSTKSGAKVGDPRERLAQLYGDKLKVTDDPVLGLNYTFIPSDTKDAAYRLRFYIREDRIAQIDIGTSDTIDQSEYCL